MPNLKNPRVAIPIVLIAGILWSFGPYVVRNIDQPETIPWQYLFTRGLVIFFLLNIYLFLEEGIGFYKNYFKVGLSGLIGGFGLGIAMITFIWSITNTTAAVTLLCLAAMPFITALLGFLFLKEKISLTVWISIIVATFGILIMAYGNTEENTLLGLQISEVKYEKLLEDGIEILIVKGKISNLSDVYRVIPGIKIVLEDDVGIRLREWIFAVDIRGLEPDSSTQFVTSLRAPPSEAVNLNCRFVDD